MMDRTGYLSKFFMVFVAHRLVSNVLDL